MWILVKILFAFHLVRPHSVTAVVDSPTEIAMNEINVLHTFRWWWFSLLSRHISWKKVKLMW